MDYSSAVGAATGGLFGMIGQGISYAANKKLQEQQNAFNLQMWNMQNEYNSPAAQMKRFESAGLNPNLIYGQGSAGNAQSAPQMGVAPAPDLSENASRIGQAFNIVGLKSAVAEMHSKQERANQEAITTANMADERNAQSMLSGSWSFNTHTGRWEYSELPPADLTASRDLPFRLRWKAPYVFGNDTGMYKMNRFKQEMYRLLEPIHLRSSLVAPQAQMLRFEAGKYPVTYWIGQGTKVAGSAANLIPVFSPLKWKYRPATTISNTRNYEQNVYNY